MVCAWVRMVCAWCAPQCMVSDTSRVCRSGSMEVGSMHAQGIIQCATPYLGTAFKTKQIAPHRAL